MPNAKAHAERVAEGTIPGGGMWQTWRVFHQELVCRDAVVDSVVNAHQLGFPQCDYHNFGLWIKVESGTASPEIAVDILQSFDDNPEHYAVAESGFWIIDGFAHVAELKIPPMRFMRIRLTGKTGNPGDTLVDTCLFMQRG